MTDLKRLTIAHGNIKYNHNMKRYSFSSYTKENRRTFVVLSLRKYGFTAYVDGNDLITNASMLAIALSCGTSTVVK